MTPAAWGTGLACALVIAAALARGVARHGTGAFGPASWITLARAALAVGVAALAVDPHGPAPIVALAGTALVLDAIDGPIARRTRTESALGARFDGEVDAFLILALSVYVAPAYGTWAVSYTHLTLPTN